ncbi:MAG: NADH-quinone oxidoreductase subunit J [Geminicoccaceae bacterium]|jgi:NADH-quinone oxidoreductase subunit J|nr:NADH-quinone oxidoreductase subunit J [Geminicoccaceae bacterium]HRY26967.1 NADH-quinone oxidoreductase subunit J [Geminicoccaceae bacterium]
MTISLFLFYILAFVATAAAVMVVAARNPVHSVLFLILAFFNAAGLFVLIGAEFLAMVLVVVYVGAVAVLFMFVVMMLDISSVRMRGGALQYLPIGLLVGIILLVELVLVGGTWTLAGSEIASPSPPLDSGVTNTEALGRLLYTDYFYAFQAAGVILLVAIIGAITLTLRERGAIRRQDISMQVHRSRAEAVQLRKVKPRAGI